MTATVELLDATSHRSTIRVGKNRRSVVVVLAAILGVDQATKWWGWHHVTNAVINVGGDPLTGPMVDRWYAAPTSGALLDLLDTGILFGLLFLVASRARHPALLLSATVMLGGWMSNLTDRLGLHYLTAPGSARGVVDFIHLGRFHYNVADLCIVVGTLCLPAIVVFLAARRRNQLTVPRATGHRPRARVLGGRPVLLAVAIGLIALVAIGAADDTGITAPPGFPQQAESAADQ